MARKRVTAAPPSREEQLFGMSDEQLACRASGHWWEVVMSWGAQDKTGVHQKNWSTWEGNCNRCGAWKRITRGAYMDQVRASSEYPEGYLLKGEKPKTGTRREALTEFARRQTR